VAKWIFGSVLLVLILINTAIGLFLMKDRLDQGSRLNKLYVAAIANAQRSALPACTTEAVRLGHPSNQFRVREIDLRYGFVTREDTLENLQERFNREPWKYASTFSVWIDLSTAETNLRCLYYLESGSIRFLSNTIDRLAEPLKRKIQQDNIFHEAAVELSSRP
jgi:hypothetical protein